MRTRKRNTKSLYVVKTCGEKLKELEEQSKSETRNLYVVRTDEEIANKYCDIVYDFVDKPGIFILVTRDKYFYQTFKNAICYTLGIENEFVRMVPDLGRAAEMLEFYTEKDVTPFVFLECILDAEMTLSFLRFVRKVYKDMLITILSRDVSRERLFQFYEEGASSFLKKPASANGIIQKIAFLLKPQCEADAMVQEAREHVDARRYDDAILVAEKVLRRWPKNAAAMVVLGDAKKGLAKRREAMNSYLLAEKNSKNYLEPLQKIVRMHVEDNNRQDALRYLIKLDRISPLNCNRKIKIAQMHIEDGDQTTAEQFFDSAIKSASEEALSVVGEMSLDIAEMASRHDPKMAVKYYRQSLDFVKSSKSQMAMTIYNRLGISLRKQGLWQEAVEAYAEAMKYAPKDENILYNMALAYAEGERYADGADHIERALCINPDMYRDKPDLAYNIGSILTKAGKHRQAAEYLLHLNEISPGFKDCDELLRMVTGDGRKTEVSQGRAGSGHDLRF